MWQEIVAKKQAQRDNLIKAATQIIDDISAGREIQGELESFDVSQLLNLQLEGKFSAIDITTHYITRAIEAHEATNCLTEVLFQDAIKQAEALDKFLYQNKRLVGPLHGVPITLKDQFNVKGVDTTLGYVGRSFAPASRDAALVTTLKSLGAVILSKTNIPQTILWGETENPLWGLTTHPLDPALTPGGSTGGEAALLSMGGSMCGWGTDIGGSIRAPSHLCALFGSKPTSSRFPYAGVPVSHEGQMHVPSSIGPMSRDLSSMISVTKACLSSRMWLTDPNVCPLPWQKDIFLEVHSRPLRIGLILDDGVVKPHPPVVGAVRAAASLLEAAGHEIVAWDTTEHLNCIEVMDQFYRADGGEDIRRDIAITGEPMLPYVQALIDSSKPISVYEYWQLNKQKIKLQEAYNDKWNATATQAQGGQNGALKPVDVILSPVMPHVALPHRKYRWVGYTKIWNFLDYTAMSVPFKTGYDSARAKDETVEPGSEDINYSDHVPRNPHDDYNKTLYNSEAMKSLPCGVQIIGRRFEEEKVLGVAQVLENLMKARNQYTNGV